MIRNIMPMAAVAVLLLAAGCSEAPKADADATAAAPKKSLARKAPFYAGQDNVQSIESATVAPDPSGGVVISAKATAASAGWTQAGFLPRIYAATPPDGVYEIDVVAQAPSAPGAAVLTPIEVKGAWSKYTDGRVKGVKLISKTNEVVAMLPAG